jgi:DNA modification methylase
VPATAVLAIKSLKPRDRNPRTHSKRQIAKLARSIQEFGFVNPVLIDADNRIIAGHGRVQAAQKLGLSEVPIVRVGHLSEEQLRAYVIADNQLASLAGWDRGLLAIELGALVDINFDVELTGFDMGTVDIVIGEHEYQNANALQEDLVEFDARAATISHPGDLWELGSHRIICGSALHATDYEAVLGEDSAQLVLTDPPFNVRVSGHVTTRDDHEEFAMAAGEMSRDEFTVFLRTMFETTKRYASSGALAFVFMDWRHQQEILEAGSVFHSLLNMSVWVKKTGGLGSLYRSRHELVFMFKVDGEAHINNVMLGANGRNRTNVWECAGFSRLANDDPEALEHPTPKPVRLLADAILDVTNRNDVVLDPFGGSGSTLIAAERTGRRARLIELEPRFVDLTVRRWQRLTGRKAIHAKTRQRFDLVAADM